MVNPGATEKAAKLFDHRPSVPALHPSPLAADDYTYLLYRSLLAGNITQTLRQLRWGAEALGRGGAASLKRNAERGGAEEVAEAR